MPQASLSRLLVVTPHPSGQLPADLLREMLGGDVFDSGKREAFARRIFLDGDPYTDLIYGLPGARHVQAPWSRFAVDLNRDRDDRDDNGVVKLTGFDRGGLYPTGFELTEEAREARLRRLWDPFDALVAQEMRGAQLMVVGHAMAPRGPALGHDPGTPRPAVCLMPGTEARPTIAREVWDDLRRLAETAFGPAIAAAPDPRVTVGEPWSTDTLSLRFSRSSGVPAFGIEVNTGLYLGAGGEPIDGAIRALNAAFAEFAGAALELVG